MTPALRETLAATLGLPTAEVDALELLVHVSAIGRSHAEPGLRLFAYRDGVALASVKRLARPTAAARDRLIGSFARFAGSAAFQVPALLAWCEDGDQLYLVEAMVPGEPLAALLARGAVTPADAAARLDAVLTALWERGEPSSEAEIDDESATLSDAAAALFGDQRAADLVGAAVGELRRRHRPLLRRVLSTRDVHLGNLHVDGQGQTWLTDFDLTAETVFFGLEVVRAWIHSAPLAASGPPAFLPADAYRLFETLYAVHEYALQAPLLAPPERDGLRIYAQDLFVRLALPDYHRQAVAQPDPHVAHPPHAQVFFADAVSGFSESESLRFPFDLASGRASLSTVIRTDRPLHALRLDPINLAHSVIRVLRWTVARQGQPVERLDAATLCAANASAAGAELSDLLALPGAPATFFATSDDPQIVLPADALAALVNGDGRDGGAAYALDIELTVLRDWTLSPALAPALLLGRMQSRIAELEAARTHDQAHARQLAAVARRQARVARRLALQLSANTAAPMTPPAGGPRAQLARLAAAARGGARAAAGAALRRLRHAPAAAPAGPPAAGLVAVACGGRAWAPPHVAVLVDLDAGPPAVAAAQAWAATQTCASTEVIAWSRGRGLAWDAHQPHTAWEARDWPALRATLAARHVAVASADLLAQPPTYLERALLALEPEDLSFAVAVGAARAPAATALLTGRGPGDGADPLARTVARAEVLADDWTIDLDACRRERGAAGGALGKLLGGNGEPPPFARPLRGAAAGVSDPYVVADPNGGGRILHPIAPADRVLPLPALPSPLPTVLMVFPFLAVGGAERVHLDVVRGLRGRGRFVIVGIEPHDDRLGTMVDAFRAETPYVYIAPDALHPLLTMSLFEHLIRRFAPHTLYVANGSGWIYDALPTIRSLYPRLRTVNQVYDFAAGWIERLDPPLMAALDAHISCNRRISAALVERGASPAAAVTIHNAPDLTLFDPAAVSAERRAAVAAQFGLPAGRRVVAFVGRMHQQKRPMDVVELARQLQGDPSLAFLLVGDGPLGATVRDQVAACGLDTVSVQSFHQPSRECYALADVLILPSEYEGMPMVILEALAMGVPVVATDVGNNREVLERTGGGRIVDRVGDVAALRDAVRALLDAPPDPAALRAAVAREFGMPDKLDAYAQVLLG